MIYLLVGILGIAIGLLISNLFAKDYSLKGVMKVVSKFFNPLYHTKDNSEYMWFVTDNGNKCSCGCRAPNNRRMIEIIRYAMRTHACNNDRNFSIIPAAAFVLYVDELSYEDRCKAYRDVRDAIREYKKETNK